jgi:hypothetical protein
MNNMSKKILSLLVLLMTAASGAWATSDISRALLSVPNSWEKDQAVFLTAEELPGFKAVTEEEAANWVPTDEDIENGAFLIYGFDAEGNMLSYATLMGAPAIKVDPGKMPHNNMYALSHGSTLQVRFYYTSDVTLVGDKTEATFTMPAAAVIVSATFKKIYVPTPTGQPTLSMSDFSIEAGGTATVNLNLVQDNVRIKAFQCAFELPAGLTMAKPKAVNGTMTDEDSEPTKPSVAFNEDGNTVAVYSGEGYAFNSDATSVLKITFTADANFQGGNIIIKGISISDKDNYGYSCEDVVTTVTLEAVVPVHEFTYQEYLLYNVGADMFLGAANNWGTQASFV